MSKVIDTKDGRTSFRRARGLTVKAGGGALIATAILGLNLLQATPHATL